MAEICCEVAAGSDRKAECGGEAGSRAARRRRIEIRRLRVVADEEPAKRRRLNGGEEDDGGHQVAGAQVRRDVGVRAAQGHGGHGVHPPGFLDGHHFFGVFDGHGCSHVATSCGERMHEIVAEEASAAAAGSSGSDEAARWTDVMEKSYARMDAEAVGSRGNAGPAPTCRCEMQLPKCDHVGSTAVVAVVGPRHLVVANCGDSRAVLCSGGVAIPLSSDHKPDRPDELERIHAAGGRVIFWDGARVFGMLAMSRAIGDSYLKPYVISDPEVRVVERKDGEDEFLILASDGLNEVACNVVRACLRSRAPRGGEQSSPTSNLSPRQSSGSSGEDEAGPSDGAGAGSDSDDGVGGEDKACADAAILLTKLALARQSADNVSVVVVNLRRRPRS
ncbi:hypothetical protein EJB05_51098 [Eragrostis curvula]|uniref:protein-serine/threonine phosphatase n=1 Tax=Eragrostis curvula TaxID=38414 RepID=A0A5J9SWR6_9POAL|nr:hypothetical protein EJB05_51098 [Eragrostis curvula]